MLLIATPVSRGRAPTPSGNLAPTAVNLSPTTPSVDIAATDGTHVADITVVDGDDTTLNSLTVSNSKFKIANISGLTADLQRSATGTVTAGVGETMTFTATDGHGNPFTSPTKTVEVVDGSAGTVITTMRITNNTGSAIPAEFIPDDYWALSFAEGDIPAGAWPRLVTAGGADVPTTFLSESRWPDGSLRTVGYIFRSPIGINASSFIDFDVKDNGTGNAAGALTTTAVTATRDLKFEATGYENLSGVYTSALNTGISDADWWWNEANGAAGRAWVFHQQFNNGSNHATAWVRHYITALDDGAGGVYGWLWMPQPVAGANGASSPSKMAFDIRLLDASTELPSSGYFAQAKTATYAGTAGTLTSAAHGYTESELVRFTTTSTLPTGITSTGIYAVKPLDTNTFEVWDSPYAAETGAYGAKLTFTSVPATLTIRKVFGLNHYGSFHCPTRNGKPHFIAGTGARANVSCRQPNAYLKSTKLFPPYDLTVTPASSGDLMEYTPNGRGYLKYYTGSPGGQPYIGISPTWAVRDFLLRNTTTEQNARIAGLTPGRFSIHLFDNTTKKMPVFNGGSYSGMPASSDTIRYNGSNGGGPGTSGVTIPVDGYPFFDSYDTSHLGSGPHYAILTMGGPWFRDIQMQMAGFAAMGRGTTETNPDAAGYNPGGINEGRVFTVGGTTYRGGGLWFGSSLERVDAWTRREMAGAYLLPDQHPDGTGVVTYLRAMISADSAALAAWLATQTSNYQNNGIWHWCVRTNGQVSPWAKNFLSASCAWTAAISSDASALTGAQHFANFLTALKASGGIYHANAYIANHSDRQSGAGGSVITDMTKICFQAYQFTADATTDVITVTYPTGAPALVNDDIVSFNTMDPSHVTMPGGLTGFQPYFVVQRSGNTFKVSLTSGGSAINLTSAGSGEISVHHQAAGLGVGSSGGLGDPDTSDGNDGENNCDGYTGVAITAVCLLQAIGCTGDLAGVVNDLRTLLSRANDPNKRDFALNPKNALDGSYT